MVNGLMKLNKNSIHAKFYKWYFMEHYLPENLCNYFWKIVFGLTVTGFAIIGVMMSVIIFAVLLPTMLGGYILGFQSTKMAFDAGFQMWQLWLPGIILLSIIFAIATTCLSYLMLPRSTPKIKNNKFCPKIEWKNE